MPSFNRRNAPAPLCTHAMPDDRAQRPYTIDEALRDCLEEVSRTTPRSHRVYSFHAKAWLAQFAGRDLSSITASDIQRTFAAWASMIKPATVSHRLNLLRRAFSQAIRDGKASLNPCVDVRCPKVKNARDRFLTHDEEERLRAQMSPQDFEIVRLALGTGLRRGELFGLRVEDCDFGSGFVHVVKTKTDVPRRVPMNPEVRTILLQQVEDLAPADLIWKKAPERWVSDRFKPALKKAGIRNFRFHDLRHTFATRLVAAGVHIREIQELMGHSTIIQTQKYSHVSPGHLLKAVNLLPGSLAAVSPAPDEVSVPIPLAQSESGSAPDSPTLHVHAVQSVPKWITAGLESLIRIIPKLESQVRRLRQESRSLRAEMRGLRADACLPNDRMSKPPVASSTAERGALIAWINDARERFGLSWGEIAKRLNNDGIKTARGCRWTAARVQNVARPILSVMRPPRPEVAARMRELRAGGMTYRGIAQRLNEEGVPTVKGGRWSFALVHRALHAADPPSAQVGESAGA